MQYLWAIRRKQFLNQKKNENKLKNQIEFTIDNLKLLIANGDDTTNTQYRVTKDGFLIVSTDVGNQNLDNILFRLETNVMGIGYVGKSASEDALWVERIYNVVKKNWPDPDSSYIDNF